MQTLGLAGPEQKPDNIVKRLFWPANNPSEVDTLGQQGFWICLGVGVLSLIALSVAGLWWLGLLSAVFFIFGGFGVREHSVLAASLVASAYVLNLMSSVVSGQFPGFLALVAALLLIANIRGTWIASQWIDKGDPELFPDRASTGILDTLVDQLPAKVWPKSRSVFYVAAVLYFLVLIAGSATVLARRIMHPIPQRVTRQQRSLTSSSRLSECSRSYLNNYKSSPRCNLHISVCERCRPVFRGGSTRARRRSSGPGGLSSSSPARLSLAWSR